MSRDSFLEIVNSSRQSIKISSMRKKFFSTQENNFKKFVESLPDPELKEDLSNFKKEVDYFIEATGNVNYRIATNSDVILNAAFLSFSLASYQIIFGYCRNTQTLQEI